MKLIVMNASIIFAQDRGFFNWMNRFVWKDCGDYLQAVSEKNYATINY